MHALYEAKNGMSFHYVSCWEFLRQQPKWDDYVSDQTSKQGRKGKKTRPVGSKKTKQQEEEDALIDKVLKKAGTNRSNNNSNVIDVTGDNSGSGNSGRTRNKTDVLGDLSGSLKQFVEMGSQFMMGAMMGISPENTIIICIRRTET